MMRIADQTKRGNVVTVIFFLMISSDVESDTFFLLSNLYEDAALELWAKDYDKNQTDARESDRDELRSADGEGTEDAAVGAVMITTTMVMIQKRVRMGHLTLDTKLEQLGPSLDPYGRSGRRVWWAEWCFNLIFLLTIMNNSTLSIVHH